MYDRFIYSGSMYEPAMDPTGALNFQDGSYFDVMREMEVTEGICTSTPIEPVQILLENGPMGTNVSEFMSCKLLDIQLIPHR